MAIRSGLDSVLASHLLLPRCIPGHVLAFKHALYRLWEEAEDVRCLSDIWRVKVSEKISIFKVLDDSLFGWTPLGIVWTAALSFEDWCIY